MPAAGARWITAHPVLRRNERKREESQKAKATREMARNAVRRVGHFAWSELDKSDIDWNIAFFDIPRSTDFSLSPLDSRRHPPPISYHPSFDSNVLKSLSLSLSVLFVLSSLPLARYSAIHRERTKREKEKKETAKESESVENKFQSEK